MIDDLCRRHLEKSFCLGFIGGVLDLDSKKRRILTSVMY
jgi:hypothetical protein